MSYNICMKILVITKPEVEAALEIVREIKLCFSKEVVKVIDIRDIYDKSIVNDIRDTDICIAVGGDGTMIRVIRAVSRFDKAVVAVNVGNLGFLSETAPSELRKALDILKNGEYKIEKRLMLEGYLKSNPEHRVVALNEILVHTKNVGNILNMDISVGDVCLGAFSADGVIISTPTGSTAYSMSAGGPIINPHSSCISMVPVCPHALSFRPLIMLENEVVEVKCFDEAELIADGAEHVFLEAGDSVVIEKSDNYAKFIDLQFTTFYDRLREKLLWGGIK